jgi:hypothetical protein
MQNDNTHVLKFKKVSKYSFIFTLDLGKSIFNVFLYLEL